MIAVPVIDIATAYNFPSIILFLVFFILQLRAARITMVLRKDELEVKLKDDNQLIKDGVLRDDSPLDVSGEFQKLCVACRIGDLKGCQEAISTGVNINARDLFDYTPLILVSSSI